MCETRDLGIKWPHWHTLIFSNDTNIDMRFVCPKDVKKMLVQRARSVYWKKCAAKHEYAELKEGAWLEPGPALQHRNVAKKIFLQGGWTQKMLFDLGWSDIRQCQACQMEEARKAQAFTTVWNRKVSANGSKRRKRRRKNGSGKDEKSPTLSVKANGIEVISE